MKRQLSLVTIISSFSLSFFASQSLANSPAEMADLSLQDLYGLSLDQMDQEFGFKIGAIYRRETLEGYKSGTDSLSYDEVLFVPGTETRTDKNYPIVPTLIEQESFVLNLAVGLDSTSTFSASIPYIKQNTDHISIVPGYDHFNIASDGLGDITFNYQSRFYQCGNKSLYLSLGVSFPTGSIDEKGDTPRAPGDQQLPYTMQLGSGTFDVPLGFSYRQSMSGYTFGTDVYAKLRFGKNSRDYRLGNRFDLSTWVSFDSFSTFEPRVTVTYQYWDRISGQDNDITVAGDFPYPAGITNYANYGGHQLNITAGLDTQVGDNRFGIELLAPIYHNLNGVQPKQNLGVSLSWHKLY